MNISAELSDRQKFYLNQIQNIIEREIPFEALMDSIDAIAYQSELYFTDDNESAIILIAASVMKYSLEYWYINIDKWVEILSNNNEMSKKLNMFSRKKVGKSDVTDAIGGTMAGAITGGGAAVTATAGAFGASVYSVFDQVLDIYF